MLRNVYLINNKEVNEEEFNSRLSQETENEFNYDAYDKLLDSKYLRFVVCDTIFNASEVLKNCNKSVYDENYKKELDNIKKYNFYKVRAYNEPLKINNVDFEIVEEEY